MCGIFMSEIVSVNIKISLMAIRIEALCDDLIWYISYFVSFLMEWKVKNVIKPVQERHAIIWTNALKLSIIPQGTCLNEILLEIQILSFKKMRFSMSSAKRRPFCPGGRWVNLWTWHCVPTVDMHPLRQGPLLLTWFNFNPSMDK